MYSHSKWNEMNLGYENNKISCLKQGGKLSNFCLKQGQVLKALVSSPTSNREIKIHVYRKWQMSDLSWEFLRIENKQIKTVQNKSYG